MAKECILSTANLPLRGLPRSSVVGNVINSYSLTAVNFSIFRFLYSCKISYRIKDLSLSVLNQSGSGFTTKTVFAHYTILSKKSSAQKGFRVNLVLVRNRCI